MSYLLDSDSDNEPFDFQQAVYCDNKQAFLDFVRVDPSCNEPCPEEVMICITRQNCLECAKAVLEGETGHIVDLSAPVGTTKVPPLHLLVGTRHSSMIELFLSHGAPVNLRCTTGDKLDDGMLPINFALMAISSSRYSLRSWPAKQSVFNLIIRMCLPKMREPLKTIKLLASKTEDIYEEIFYYAREGQIVQLAALLLVAHEKFVTAEITLLEAMRIRLEHSHNYQMFHRCKEKLVNMMQLLQLLEIFKRAGKQLAAYVMLEPNEENFSKEILNEKVSKEVAWLLKQAGFTLKAEDLVVMEYEELLLNPCHKEAMQTTRHVLGKTFCRRTDRDLRHLVNRKEHKLAGVDFPCTMQEGSEQHLQQESNVVQKKIRKEQVSNGNSRKKQVSNGSSRKRPVKDSENSNQDLSPPVARPYKQWRFASTELLRQSHSFSTQALGQLQILDDVLNSCCEDGQSKCNSDLLRLGMAIGRLCHHQYLRDWTNQKSIFKLLYILCLPELKEEWERIRVFARNNHDIGALGCSYAKEGKIIELAILLFVAQEKLVPLAESSSTNVMVSDESMQIGKCLMSEIQKLIDMKADLIGKSQCNELVQKYKDKKSVLLSALLLLEVFERAGDAFEKYLRSSLYADHQGRKKEVVFDVAWLLQRLGFLLTQEDMFLNDLDCFWYKPRPEELETLNIKVGSLVSLKLHNVSWPKKIGVANGQRRDHALSFPRISHAYNPVQSFHTVPNSKASYISLSLPLQNQVLGVPIKYDPPRLNFPFGERWMHFALAIKRGMKRV